MSETGILSDYIDRPTLAREMKCAERTIARYEAEPDGLASVLIAGKRYYRIAAVREFLTKRERRPNPRQAA